MSFTLPAVLETVATALPDQEAFVFGERRLTYSEFDQRANALGNLLLDKAGQLFGLLSLEDVPFRVSTGDFGGAASVGFPLDERCVGLGYGGLGVVLAGDGFSLEGRHRNPALHVGALLSFL